MDTRLLVLLVLVALPTCQAQTADAECNPDSNCPSGGGVCKLFSYEPAAEEHIILGNNCDLGDQLCLCIVNCDDATRTCTDGGTCKGSCDYTEYSTSFPLSDDPAVCSGFCLCCHSCIDTTQGWCDGRCVSNSDYCYGTEWADDSAASGCVAGECVCCRECGAANQECINLGGICWRASEPCPCGFVDTTLSATAGCDASPNCKCCVPCIQTCMNGLCVPTPNFCQGREFYTPTTSCCERPQNALTGITCTYCMECQEGVSCSEECGVCVKRGAGCGPGRIKSSSGQCTDDANCMCCKPDPCPDSCDCVAGDNPGVCSPPRAVGCNEYVAAYDCMGSIDCTCYRTCTPQQSCSDAGGSCFSIQGGGCSTHLQEHTTAQCDEPSECVCCVRKVVKE